jgi:hypothetical protein
VVALVAGVIALAISLGHFPYTPLRPQRLTLVHEQDQSGGTLRVYGVDFNTPTRALTRVAEMRPVSARSTRTHTFSRAAGPTTLPDPTLELVRRTNAVTLGARMLDLRALASGAYRLRLRLPAGRIVGWSIPTARSALAADSQLDLDYVAPPDTGWHLSLEVRGEEPLPITVEAVRATATPSAAEVMRQLPRWTDAYALAVNRREFRY